MPDSAGNAEADVTHLLRAVSVGEGGAENALMAAVYDELRMMARAKMARERPGQTIQATALVHEAWLRLGDQTFENRAHFFSAAAEAMRRFLVDRARRRSCKMHGGGAEHVDMDEVEIVAPVANDDELLAVHETLSRLAAIDPRKAELVKLRYFVGLSFEETAELLGISVATAKRDWDYARAWLGHEITRD
jgi:RNA polymerase sigma factor (TIGR02999 family)